MDTDPTPRRLIVTGLYYDVSLAAESVFNLGVDFVQPLLGTFSLVPIGRDLGCSSAL